MISQIKCAVRRRRSSQGWCGLDQLAATPSHHGSHSRKRHVEDPKRITRVITLELTQHVTTNHQCHRQHKMQYRAMHIYVHRAVKMYSHENEM